MGDTNGTPTNDFKRVAQIAMRCPVHKTLTNGIHIDDNAMFGEEN